MKKKSFRVRLRRFQHILGLFFFFNLSVVSMYGQTSTVIYVRKGAAATGDGTSWVKAYPDLQQAITAAISLSGNKEIWVARGEYRPTSTLDRSVSFVLPTQTFLFGGFAGTETSKESRNWINNRTVLSGDLGILFDKSDNSYHVLVGKNLDRNSGIDGFIITQGNANGTSAPTFNDSGAGMLAINTTSTPGPKINNCEFVNNSANLYGGGLANIAYTGSISTEITNCYFNGNTALVAGGGAGNYKVIGISSPYFVNCSFSTNHTNGQGGGVINKNANPNFINCTFSMNNCLNDGGAIFNDNSPSTITNSILWKNFKGTSLAQSVYNQIGNYQCSPSIGNNIIQGGYGIAADKNIDADPLFIKEPSFDGKIPRTSIIPVGATDPKYENITTLAGPLMPGSHTYYSYKDPIYNKLYISGLNVQIIDFNNLSNNLPTSIIHPETFWGRIQRLDKSIYQDGNKIYIASTRAGIFAIDRATGVSSLIDPLIGEPLTYSQCKVQDIVVVNNLLYAPIFYWPDNKFYGLLELNLSNNAKRWISTTSAPVSIPQVNEMGDGPYWSGHHVYHDEVTNTLYYSMGYGVWWWNRNTNATGVYNTEGGMPLAPGNPNIPSNLTTSMYIDQAENKFYIGTHAGLFVWNRNDNTSKVYNTTNSLLAHNLINHIDGNNDKNLIYAACEEGGVFIIDKVTDEQKLLKKDLGNDSNPQLIDTPTSSINYDENDKKLYVSTDHWNGGLWIKDYGNLLPDYGDLRLLNGSPAVDIADENRLISLFPNLTVDITGLKRFVDFRSIDGVNSLDLGANEKVFDQANDVGRCETFYCDDITGSVGIGTPTVANGYILSIKGKLILEGARLTLNSKWPDYVFEKDYSLMSLPELKQYIVNNGHLPSLPSAKVVKAEGVDVGDMSVLLMKKTEELTLYFIQLNDRLNKLEAEHSKPNKN